MVRAICMAVIFMMAAAEVQANECPSGGECPSDDEPQNLVSLLQTKPRMDELGELQWMDVPGALEDGPSMMKNPGTMLSESQGMVSSGEKPARNALDLIATDGSKLSGLHDVVGQDGVLLISLDRTPERFQHTKESFAQGGVLATKFQATDADTATDDELGQGCTIHYSSTAEFLDNPQCAAVTEAWGEPGCGTKAEQAVADSHRRALIAASKRKMDWTAIVEDDMSLIDSTKWDQAFKKAWAQVPKETKIVRLNWCTIIPSKFDKTDVYAETEDIVLSKWLGVPSTPENPTGYDPGLCTGAYMVHRDIVPEMLKLFPCCSAVDWCYFDMSKSKASGEFRGMEVMMNMAVQNSRPTIESVTKELWYGQHGVMFQDRKALKSVKDR